MNSATIRRGNAGRARPRAQVRGPVKAQGRGGRSVRRQSRIDRLLALLPVSEATLQRGAVWAIVAIFAGLFLAALSFFGVPSMLSKEFAELAARSGFEVKKVEVRGVERMDELQVYNIALGQVDRSMATLDLSELREGLMTLGWVRDARVSRRLPDTLVVDIVERQPVAVWQHDGRLNLIDVSGAVLETVRASAMPDLPLVIGPQANMHTPALDQLLGAAPALRPLLAGATWVGNRRWDLRFQSGETLALPEGEEQAADALVSFARMDGVNRLLGRGIIRFDMRDPDKFVLRLPRDKATTAAQRNEAKAEAAETAAANLDEEG